jgi:class 3 adenylate cyclase
MESKMDHGSRAIKAAIDIVKNVRSTPEEAAIPIAIGIHTGFSMATALGHNAPRYTLIGKSVNVAKAVAEGCQPMRIQVSDTTYKLLVDSRKSNIAFHEVKRSIDTKNNEPPLKIWLVECGA